MATERHPVKLACRVLKVSESGYYAKRSRPPSVRSVRHAWLNDLIRQAHFASRGTYGIRRVHAELTLGQAFSNHPVLEVIEHDIDRAAALTGDRDTRWLGALAEEVRSA